jgi:hypothetical protein
MNTHAQVRARRDAVLLTGAVAAVSLLMLARCGGGPDPAARPRRPVATTTSTVTVAAVATPAPTTAPVAPTGPPATTEEAPPPSSGPPALATNDDVARIAVGFLHAWLLRADIDTRRAELAGTDTPADSSDDWALPDYAAMTAFADPARLPRGERVEVDSVELRGDLGAAVVAHIDGIAVRVDLVRTGRGYLVENHASMR